MSEHHEHHEEEKKCLKKTCCQALGNLKACVTEKACCLVSSTKALACRVYRELQNPVVLVNVILGSSVLVTLLQSYAKYEHRFLQGKSDGKILACAGTAVALLTLDGFVSSKYYKQFDKK
ncbi:Om14p RNJ42_02063 [Nakaseomyces bracarensis]|uniref:Om14p n=1 Tax=Nakaseomyces bracarensis TaxID=273131 RepID=UPI003871D348